MRDEDVGAICIFLVLLFLPLACFAPQEGGPDMFYYDGTPLYQTRAVESYRREAAMDDEWQYHQDGRDEAANTGCLLLIGLAVASVAFGVASVVLDGQDPLVSAVLTVFCILGWVFIACIV